MLRQASPASAFGACQTLSIMKITISIVALLLTAQVYAMDCPMSWTAQSAEIAFVGSVTAVEESPYSPPGRGRVCWERSVEHPQCGGKLVTLQVSDRIRGDLASSVTVVSEDACYCLGNYWKKGATYLVFAKPNNGRVPGELIASNLCSGTTELRDPDRAQPYIRALKEAKQ